MKKTKTGFRISKNGRPISTIEKEAIIKKNYDGKSIKNNGTYYFFDRCQGGLNVYLP